MGKKVKVVTKCGETFTYDHDQEVETVEIVEEKITEIGSINSEDVAKGLTEMGDGWAFTITNDGTNIIIDPCGTRDRLWNSLLKQKRR